MTRTLNEITQEIAKYHEVLNAVEGDVEKAAAALGMTQEAFLSAYDKLAFEDAEKLDNYILSIEMDRSEEAAAQAMVDQWEERIKSYRATVKAKQKSQEWKKARLKFNMEVKGETKITTSQGRKIWIQNNSSTPLVIDEEKFNALTDDQLKLLDDVGIVAMIPTLNKEALREALDGLPVCPADTLVTEFAKLGERGTHVRIK